MLAITDYGVGNLFSLRSSLDAIGVEASVTADEAEIAAADQVILPGVGAFADAARQLRETGMEEIIRREAAAGKPIMGICLGMQLLFDQSLEYGEHRGLGLIPGVVRPIAGASDRNLKIPHIGWNQLMFRGERDPLFRYIGEGTHVYFVHSFYAAECEESTIAVTDYGIPLTAAVRKGNVIGCQFHPEKSGEAGLSILRAFCGI